MQTATDILAVLEKWAAEKQPIDPGSWVEAAMKLSALMGNESDLLYEMEQKVAGMRVALLEEGKSATDAKMRVEASNEHKEARKQKAKIDRIVETIRLAKLRSRMASDEFKGN
jgi:hypothetical protein